MKPEASEIPRRNGCALVCVDPAEVHKFWPHVEWLIEKAMWSGTGDETLEEVRDRVLAGQSLLWIIWDESAKELLATGITNLINTAAGKVCVISKQAGKNMERWQGFIEDIEAYAKREGCVKTRIYGRPGWERSLRGYTKPWVTIEKAL